MYNNIWDNIVNGFSLSSINFPPIRLSDFIDIALVAVIIYIILIWIKNTRAWSLFRGLAIIAAVALISYRFHFYTLTWLIEKTFSVGIIAIVILFQPELRKALEQIGESGFSGLADILNVEKSTRLNHTSVDCIVEACVKMAKEKTGALIVVEHNVPVGDFVSRGIEIDSHISSQLLMNIFVNKTPLHDGAVIIRDNRIAAASCILPVTQKKLASELGTRHRAAVGASEQSDAYIIIVSEETGDISVANDGRLMRNLTENDLRNVLDTLVEGKTINTKFFKNRSRGKGKGKKQ
ncbi:MAG: diadenylate cyclase CdaA [Firmicutes bacterium]|nr:diadenylate cyclase CdaA [Bacillota bacterium]